MFYKTLYFRLLPVFWFSLAYHQCYIRFLYIRKLYTLWQMAIDYSLLIRTTHAAIIIRYIFFFAVRQSRN